ncbi:conserved Plasmodium protein, unknown function [Plasmodium vinckei brucechwatti]|uniref:Uncharacterized protein n=1 Tax=Plasmodium vinckei brucechwatti TaxID=119398 RepID=A0A6V7S0S2_PLAVN|nr:conserved Plasmodium protein, unknown function [Plasmodium vinckei brucechwatti]
MECLYNVQLFQKGIEEIKLMKKLINGQIDISAIKNEGGYINKLAQIRLLNKKNKKYNDLASSEKVKSCATKKGKKSRNNSSSNGNKKEQQNEDNSNNQNSQNNENSQNNQNANNGSNENNNGNDGSDDGEDKEKKNNFIENDSDDEEEEEEQKNKSIEKDSNNEEEEEEKNKSIENNFDEIQNENNSEITNNGHTNEDNNIINRIDSPIKEYSYEDSRIEACIYENIKTENEQINNDKFNENKKDYYGNPFTASSCEDAMKMSMPNGSFVNSNEINKEDKNKTNKVVKKLKFQDEQNDEDNSPPQYSSFIKHYVTNVGDNNKYILKNNIPNFPIESQSFEFNKSSNEMSSVDYNSLSSIEHKKKCCNLPNFCNFGGNTNEDKNNNDSKESFEKCESNEFKTTKSHASIHPGYYDNFNYKNIFSSLKKYDCTNPTNYLQNYNCMKNTQEFIKNHSIEEGIEFIKNNVDFEKIKTNVDVEKIARNLTMNSLRQNLSVHLIKNKIDIEKISKQLNVRQIMSKIYIKNPKYNIDFQTIKKYIDINQITQNADSFDGSYELEDLFTNYIQTYVDNIKHTIDMQAMKNNSYGIFQSCNAQLLNTNYVKAATKSIQTINSMYSKSKSNLSLDDHKKYIAFNQSKSVSLIKSYYTKKATSVKKKIEVNKKFLNNYFNACMIDCSNDSEMLGSNELAQNSLADYQFSKSGSSYPEKSMDLEDMRLKSFFKTANYNDAQKKGFFSGLCCGDVENMDADEALNSEPSLVPEQSMNLEDMRLKSFFKTANYNDVQKKGLCSGMCCSGAKSMDADEALNSEPSLVPEQSMNLEDMRLKSFFKTANYNDVQKKGLCTGMCCGGANSMDADEALNNEPSLVPEQSMNLEDMRLKSFFKTANYNDVEKKKFCSGMCCDGAKSMDADEELNNEPSLVPEQSMNLEDMRLKSFFKTANYNDVQKKGLCTGMCCGGAKSMDADEALNNEPSLVPEQSMNLEDMRLKSFFKTANYNDVQKKGLCTGMCCGGAKSMDADEALNNEPSLVPEQSMNLEDMRLKSFFKTANYNDVQKKGLCTGMCCGAAKSVDADETLNNEPSLTPEQSMNLEDMRLKSFFKTANYNDIEKKKGLCSGMCCAAAKSMDADEALNNEPSLVPEQSMNLEDMRLKSFFKTANYNDIEKKKGLCYGMCCAAAKSGDANETLNNEPSLEQEQSMNLEDMRLKSFFKTANYNDVEKKKFYSGMCCAAAKSMDADETLNNEPSLEQEQSMNLEDMRLKSFFKTANYNDLEKKKFYSGMCCAAAKSMDADETLNNEPSLEQEQSMNLEDMRLNSFFKTANYNDIEKKKGFFSGMYCGAAKSMNADETLDKDSTVHFDTQESETCDCPHKHLGQANQHEDDLETNVTCFSRPKNHLRYMKVVLPNDEESDIIYDDRKKIFFDLDGNAYAHIVHNLYFNVKDKLVYEIYYVDEINYEQIRNSLVKFGNYMVTEKYAPCKIIMEMCKKFNNIMSNILGVNKSETYYLDRENLVEVIIK